MAKTEVGRFGNLNGNYGLSSDVIGLAIGEYYANTPNLVYRSDIGELSFNIYSTPYMKLEYNSGTPRVWLGSTSNAVQITANGLDVGTSGNIKGGQTAYNTGTGFWLGYDTSAYKFSIGNGTSQYLTFDGTNLSIGGTLTAGSGTIGGWEITPIALTKNNTTLSSAGEITLGTSNDIVKLSSVDATYRLWIGNATATSAPFSVSKAGAIKAESGVVGGFTLSSTTLTGGTTNLILDSSNKAISINNATFGAQGIQLQYHGGTPRVYMGNGSTRYINFDGTNLSWSGGNTSLTTTGILHAKDAILSGTMTASAGTIGGWALSSTALTGGDSTLHSTGYLNLGTGDDIVKLSSVDATYRIWAGNATAASAPFSVSKAGAIVASTGTIGGWTTSSVGFISPDSKVGLSSTNNKIYINGSTFGSAGIQLYNDVSLGGQAYIGDGANNYIKYQGTSLSWRAANTQLDGSGNLHANNFRGSNIIVSGTVTASAGAIGGWLIGASAIVSALGDINLNSSYDAPAITIKSSTFGASGIQLDYNSGRPRFYVGDGSTKYLNFDGTDLSWAGVNTSLSAAGLFTASNAIITGNITASSGAIGGWTITASSLYSGLSGGGEANIFLDAANKRFSVNSSTFGNNGIQLEYNSGTPRAYIGNGSTQYFKFDGTTIAFAGINTSLTEAGVFTAANAVLTGSITANSGAIGGWTISASKLASTNINIDSANQRIVSSDYVSGPNGAGFLISKDLIETNNISARGMIRTAVFQKDVISAIGGSFAVLNSDVLITDMTAADSQHIIISGTSSFSSGDILRIKDGENDEWLEVTSVSSNNYTVTRDKAGVYGANANPAWKKGATVVSYGQSGGGGLFFTASETNAPYMEVFDHTGSPWSTINTRARLGNLNGYLGYSSDIYGLGVGSTTSTNVNLTVDPTNGFRLRNGTTDKFVVDQSGNVGIYDAQILLTSGTGADRGQIELNPELAAIKFYRNDPAELVAEYKLNIISLKGYKEYGYNVKPIIRLDSNSEGGSHLYCESDSIQSYNSTTKKGFGIGGGLALYGGPNSYIYLSFTQGFRMISGTSITSDVTSYISPTGGLGIAKGISIGYAIDADADFGGQNYLSTSSHGSSSTTMYIGNKSIDTSVPSDKRLKENINNTVDSLDDLLKLEVKDFTFKKEYRDDTETIEKGLIAQDLLEVYPYPVRKLESNFYEVEYKKLIPLLIKSVQDLNEKVEQQNIKIKKQEIEIKKLKKQLKQK